MISKSFCFGLYIIPHIDGMYFIIIFFVKYLESCTELIVTEGHESPSQIGFARLIADEVTFAYLADVHVLQEYQGCGLGSWLMECVDERWRDGRI